MIGALFELIVKAMFRLNPGEDSAPVEMLSLGLKLANGSVMPKKNVALVTVVAAVTPEFDNTNVAVPCTNGLNCCYRLKCPRWGS